MIALLFLSLALILNSCGGGGGGGGGISIIQGPPAIFAELVRFPTGSVPPGLIPSGLNSMASVYVIDDYSGEPIANAAVSMNNILLTFNAADQDYAGNLAVAPGESVILRVTVGGNTYIASGTQFTSYPTISAPGLGTSWQTGYASTILWSGGAPLAGSYYGLGILDADDPKGPLVWPSDDFITTVSQSTTSYSIPANSLTVGNRQVIVGIGIEKYTILGAGCWFSINGFSYVPVAVTDATLVSIAVTPSDPSIAKGRTQ